MYVIKPLILCGGSGSRLWPLSRADFPKQFIEYSDDTNGTRSLFKSALTRLVIGKMNESIEVDTPMVVAGQVHRFIIQSQIETTMERQAVKLLLEPTGKNTAASVTMAALACKDSDPILAVIPSDQAIDTKSFREAITKATKKASEDSIVLLGVSPTRPETGYGYIQTTNGKQLVDLLEVSNFCEKPNLNKAQEYLQAGNFLWNAGIFILKASVWLKALKTCRPDIYKACIEANKTAVEHDNVITYDEKLWNNIPSESVDYAVLEKCSSIQQPLFVIPFDALWTDLGSWDSIHKLISNKDEKNFISGNVILNNTSNSLVIAKSRLVVTNGVQNLAIIETQDALLVSNLEDCQKVKDIVNSLKKAGRPEATMNRRGYRPWGYFDTLDEAPGFKVKCIVVSPGQRLSLQKHHHRAEHWVVTRGEAVVQIGETEQILKTNQSVFIPKGEIHRLSNRTKETLCIIEVQTGTYLGEDDIIRLDDMYDR